MLRGKGQKKKKVSLRFTIDCTNIAEDSIMDVADFVSTWGTQMITNLTAQYQALVTICRCFQDVMGDVLPISIFHCLW